MREDDRCLDAEDVQHSHKEITTTLTDNSIKQEMRDTHCSSKVSNNQNQTVLFHMKNKNRHVHTATIWEWQQHLN